MAKPNALQEQLLKAGLAKKSQASAAAREQAKARQGKAESTSAEVQREAERARAEKVERDRALAAERNAQARQAEHKAQARQIITAHAVPHKGDDEYRFNDGAAIRTLLIDPKLRKEKPPTEFELNRYAQLRVSSYRERSSASLDGGLVERRVEIGVINQNTQAERTVVVVERWRWDPGAKRWWQTAGLPDLWKGQ